MILSQQAVIDFKKAYLLDAGKRINNESAQELGVQLLEFFSLIFRPIPKEEKLDVLVTKQNKYGKNNK